VNKILVSVIVPVYNKYEFLDECIKSIVAQSYKNIEIIIINDGSTDDSSTIIDSWKSKDDRIRYIKQENQGVSKTRNYGITISKGHYIYFVDADDMIDHKAIEILVHNIKEIQQPDIVSGNYYKIESGQKKKRPRTRRKYIHSDRLSNTAIKAEMFLTGGRPLAQVCNKLYKLEFIKKNNLRFMNGVLAEDRLFNLMAYVNNPSILIVDEYTYYYNIINNSRSREYSKKFFIENMALLNEFNKYLHYKGLEQNNDDLLQINAIFELEKTLKYYYSNNKNNKETTSVIKQMKAHKLFYNILLNVSRKQTLKKLPLNKRYYFNTKILINLFLYTPSYFTFLYYNLYRNIRKFKNN